jgi:hypothetical protein
LSWLTSNLTRLHVRRLLPRLAPGAVVVQAADPTEADDVRGRGGTLLDRTPERRLLAEADVCPVLIVVGDEGAGQLAQVVLVQDDDVVEQLLVAER